MAESAKLSNLKGLLTRAHRERWTDVQWSIHSKPLMAGIPSNEVSGALIATKLPYYIGANSSCVFFRLPSISFNFWYEWKPFNIVLSCSLYQLSGVLYVRLIFSAFYIFTLVVLFLQLIPMSVGYESICKMEDASRVYCLKALVETVLSLIPGTGFVFSFFISSK